MAELTILYANVFVVLQPTQLKNFTISSYRILDLSCPTQKNGHLTDIDVQLGNVTESPTWPYDITLLTGTRKAKDH